MAPFTPVHPTSPSLFEAGDVSVCNGSQLWGMNAVTSLTAPWVRTASSKELIGLNVRNPFRGAQIWRAWKPAGALAWWHGKAPAPVDGWIDILWYFCAFILVHGQENIDSSSSLASLAFFVQGITGINEGHLTSDCSCPKLVQHWNQFQPSSWNSLDSTLGSSFSLQISPSCNFRCKGQFDIVSPANICRAVCFRRIPQHVSLFFQCFSNRTWLELDVVLVTCPVGFYKSTAKLRCVSFR